MERTSAVLFFALLAAACQPAPERPSPAAATSMGLAGTSWRLVEFQSMDDAQGTTRPADPTKYTIAFGADGRLSMQLDCNRGTGAWQAEPAGDGSGSISIGPVAATRMLCPPPSMGEKLARDMESVRGYIVRDGRLSLSLMADGGIYIWEKP
jgi:heat shock protein HslJ